MFKKLTSIFFLCLLTSANTIVGASESDSQASESNTVINTNVEYAESRVLKKISKEESRLKTYKEHLNNSQNGEEVKHWLKKVKSSEKKIKNLNEALFGIELLKTRIGS